MPVTPREPGPFAEGVPSAGADGLNGLATSHGSVAIPANVHGHRHWRALALA